MCELESSEDSLGLTVVSVCSRLECACLVSLPAPSAWRERQVNEMTMSINTSLVELETIPSCLVPREDGKKQCEEEDNSQERER